MHDPGPAHAQGGTGQLTGLPDTAPILLDAAVVVLTKSGDVEDQIRCDRDKICQEKLSDPLVSLANLGSSWWCRRIDIRNWF